MRIFRKLNLQWWDVLLLVLVLVGGYVGWKLLWFSTDDAYGNYRYISNHMKGYGYVWNPPPFVPVNGFSNLLWLMILEFVWAVFGVMPPDSAQWVSLFFGYGILGVVYLFCRRMSLPEPFERFRFLLTALVFVFLLSNKTFLMWLSAGGLGRALFNFIVLSWLYLALTPPENRSKHWVFLLTSFAALSEICRPDGILMVLASFGLLVLRPTQGRLRVSVPERGVLLRALPLLLVPIHLVWRRLTYGQWQPNSYYTTFVTFWPEVGARYLAAFLLEYAVWFWVLAVSWALFRMRKHWLRVDPWLTKPHLVLPLGALGFHFLYYTFVIGGDYFEYRAYSHLIPLLILSLIYLLGKVVGRFRNLLTPVVLFILLSIPLPWSHHVYSYSLTLEESSPEFLPIRVRERIWWPFQPIAKVWDGLIYSLNMKSVGIRHHFLRRNELYVAALPSRSEGEQIPWDDRPVGFVYAAGVLSWVLPNVALIDAYGLNDRVISRSADLRFPKDQLHLRHSHKLPPGYRDCFKPNMHWTAGAARAHFLIPGQPEWVRPESIAPEPRAEPLTDDQIIECQSRFWALVSKES